MNDLLREKGLNINTLGAPLDENTLMSIAEGLTLVNFDIQCYTLLVLNILTDAP